MTSTSPPTAWARSERDSEVVAHAPAGQRGQGRPLIAGEDVAPLALLALAWLAAILIIDPRGSMVFIDDWAYRRSAAELALTGTFAPHPWSAANILGHTVWGAAFVRVLGDQPMAYTASTLVLGYLGGAALYLWLRQVGTGRALALFAAGCLLANPIYLALSVTFMTDVPYAAVQTLALLLLGTALASGRPLLAAAGWVVAVFALSWRQVALAIPLAMAIARLVTAPRRVAVLGLAILPVLAFLVLQRGYEASLAAAGITPLQFNFNAEEIGQLLRGPVARLAVAAALGLVYALLYLGLFGLPVIIIAYAAMARGLGRRAPALHAAVLAATAGVAGLMFFVFGDPMPLWGDVFGRWGLGPDHHHPEPPFVWSVGLTLASAAGGFMGLSVLILRLVQIWRGDRRDAVIIHLTLAFAVGLALYAPIPVMPSRFDRYILPILPCLFLVLLAVPRGEPSFAPRRAGPLAGALACLTLAAFGGWAIAGTHDYVATSRARQAGLDQALALGEPRERINAGWVLNGRDLYGRIGTPRGTTSVGSWHGDPAIVVDVLSYHGYETVSRIPVSRMIPWRGKNDGSVLVQRRRPGVGTLIGPPSYDELKSPVFGLADEPPPPR